MTKTDLHTLSATEISRRVRSREISIPEVVDASLAQIEKINPDLNAFCFVYPEAARKAALERQAALIRGDVAGPLHGVPVAIKDLTKTKGGRTTLGSRIYSDWVPDSDAVVVERLRAAGAIIVGKTTTPEFAYSSFTESPLWGITRNPWNPNHTSGGSSGGSAVAVATGCVPLAEGSDAGGSVRIPAAWSGTVGLKPSLGRIPMDILASHFADIMHFGPLARTVDDAATFLNVTQGPDDRDIASLPPLPCVPVPLPRSVKGLRLALSHDLGYYAVDDDIVSNLDAVADALRHGGAIVDVVELPWSREINDAFYDYWRTLMSALFGHHLPKWRDRMDPLVVRIIEEAAEVSGRRVMELGVVRTRAWEAIRPIFERYDAMLCPTMSVVAPEVGGNEFDFDYDDALGKCHALDMTLPFNMISRCPALSVPSGLARNNLPTAVQIVGRRFDDATVLRVGAAIEELRPWPAWPAGIASSR